MLRYFLSLTLKLASNHLHISSSNWCEGSHSKGTLIEFLSRIILTQPLLSHGNQSFPQYFYSVICQCTIKTLLDDSNLNAFQAFWPRLNILRLVDVPLFIDDGNFRSADSPASLSNFHSTKFAKDAHARSCHVTSHLPFFLTHQLPVVL